MSKAFKIAFEEAQEQIDTRTIEEIEEEHQRLALEIDEDSQELDRQSDLIEGLESLRLIASQLDVPSPTQVALFKVAANMAVAGTKEKAQDFLPAMESNKPIAVEGFVEKIKEIIKAIIEKLKDWWKRIKEFIKNLFSKEIKVKANDDKLNEDIIKVKEESKITEIFKVKTPTPYEIFNPNIEILKTYSEVLKHHTPVEPIKSINSTNTKKTDFNDTINLIKKQTELQKEVHEKLSKILIPEVIDIYDEKSIIFAQGNESFIWVYMEKGNYLGELTAYIKKNVYTVESAKNEIISGLILLEKNISDFNKSFLLYIKEEKEFRKANEIYLKSHLKKIEKNYIDVVRKFALHYGNPSLLSEQSKSGLSYHIEITGGYGFQTTIENNEVTDIQFVHKVYSENRNTKCPIKMDTDHIEKCIGYRSDVLKSIIVDNKKFNDFVTHKMSLNENLVSALQTALHHLDLDEDGVRIINECKKYIVKIDNFVLTLNKYNNYILNVIDESTRISNHILKLWKPTVIEI